MKQVIQDSNHHHQRHPASADDAISESSHVPKLACEHDTREFSSQQHCCRQKLSPLQPLPTTYKTIFTPVLYLLPSSLRSLYTPIPYLTLSPIQLSLCLFAFFYYLRPSEPFLVEYLLIKSNNAHPAQPNLTLDDVLHRIFPLWTYSYPFFQLFVGLTSDTIIPLKLLIIFGLIAAILSAVLVIFPINSIIPPQLSQFTIALSISCHQAYFALVYHVSRKKDYQKISSFSRFFYLLGHTIGAIIGQVWWLIWFGNGGRRDSHRDPSRLVDLFCITMFCSFVCIVVAFVFFPSASSEYLDVFLRANGINDDAEDDDDNKVGPDDNANKHIYVSESHDDLLFDQGLTLDQPHTTEVPSFATSASTAPHTQTRPLPAHRLSVVAPSSVHSTEMDSLLGTPVSAHSLSPLGDSSQPNGPLTAPPTNFSQQIKKYFSQILHAYTISNVVFWSLFNIVAVAIHQLSITYYQTLFKKIDPSVSFNGFVIAVAYIFAAFATLIPSRFNSVLKKKKSSILQQVCILLVLFMALMLLSLSQLNGIIVKMRPLFRLLIAYTVFIIYHCLFEFLHVIATTQIASSMRFARFTAVFSLNSVLQNLCQMVIQVVIGSGVLGLDAFKQYLMFGGLLGGLAVLLYLFMGLIFVGNKVKRWIEGRRNGKLTQFISVQ
mmetsp:Transcript_1314/g.4504  ORF Transcript_1314/g.4504 Transcript_1314/m.4504 type:complete len:660 (+) Transcript_1314:391-2370(+)